MQITTTNLLLKLYLINSLNYNKKENKKRKKETVLFISYYNKNNFKICNFYL